MQVNVLLEKFIKCISELSSFWDLLANANVGDIVDSVLQLRGNFGEAEEGFHPVENEIDQILKT